MNVLCCHCQHGLYAHLPQLIPSSLWKASVIRLSSTFNPSHYAVLGVAETASLKEIKSAFIRRSKELHPDRKRNSGDVKSHEQFVRITEAYQILRDKTKRSDYDNDLSYHRAAPRMDYRHAYRSQDASNASSSQVFEEYLRRMNFPKAEKAPPVGTVNYYGFRGWKRVSNTVIVWGCLIWIVVGITLHFTSYQISLFLRRVDARNKQLVNAQDYMAVRERAQTNKSWDDFAVNLNLEPDDNQSRLTRE